MRLTSPAQALLAQRGHLFNWVPVCLAIGIGGYFALNSEPSLMQTGFAALTAVAFAGLGLRVGPALGPLLMAVALVLAGGVTAKLRVETRAAPVLEFRYYGPIEGRVVNIDRSASDAVRLTLDQVVLADVRPERSPRKVRISLHGSQVLKVFQPGDTLILTGHLSPPSGPAEPGGFDFQRHAWFAGLGAVGYTRTPVLRLSPADTGDWGLWVFQTRMAISRAVQDAIPGPTGAFAAAITTGDRAGMAQDTLQDLRDTNLAHLLAISGLHMGLLTGFVFAALRFGLVLVPRVGVTWPVKKVAATGALLVGAFYLALSGGNVATERAYIMVAVMFCAILLDRRALTLRAVALAATIILLWQPEALTGPGFQMSFAATTALVFVFASLRDFRMGRWPSWARGAVSVVISSFVAGIATAPIAAAHFNQFAHFGLIANVLSVPMMGAVIMPAAVLAVILAPVGLAGIGLAIMHLGLSWILFVAEGVARWSGAVGYIVAPGPWILPLFGLGAVWVILWHGKLRWVGMVAVAASFLAWSQTTRPELLIADNGSLIGKLTADGRALSRARGSGFVAGIWLENDGAPVSQEEAARRPGFDSADRLVWAEVGGAQILQVSGKTALAALEGCGGADILVSNQPDAGLRPCEVFDLRRLRGTGALAIDPAEGEGGWRITTARQVTGDRPWTPTLPDKLD